MSLKSETAANFFIGGFNCAQSVLAAFCEEFELDTRLALMLASGLGRGCGHGGVCGALSGAVLATGLKYGYDSPGDGGAINNCNAKRSRVVDEFVSRFGSTLCYELLGCDSPSGEWLEKLGSIGNDRAGSSCVGFVRTAAEIFENED